MATWAERRDAYYTAERERNRQEAKRNALNAILSDSYEPGKTEAVPFVDEQAQFMGVEQPQNALVAGYKSTPGRLNMENALARMYQGGYGIEAMQIEQAAAAQQKDMNKLVLEYQLKDALQNKQLGRAADIFRQLGGAGGGQYGTSMEVGPQGPKISFDPSKASDTLVKRGEYEYNTGRPLGGGPVYPGTAPGSAPGDNLTPKARDALNAERAKESAKRTEKANSMIDLINQARSNLTNASGGLAGTAWSAGKTAFGISDATTQANQNLKMIGGWMVSNVPRMEGPQSDYDVKNYKEMAAKVGDSTIPIGDRLAALDTLEALQKKYASPQGSVPGPAKGPQIGLIKDGYMYMGGDPAAPGSWRPVK